MTNFLQKAGFTHRPEFRRLFIHCSAWLAFILYEMTTVFFVHGSLSGALVTLLYYFIYIGLFYLHADHILPFIFDQSNPRNKLLAPLLLAELAACLVIKFLLDRYVAGYRLPVINAVMITRYLFLGAWRIVYFLALSSLYWLIRRIFRYREALNAAEKQQLAAINEKTLADQEMAELRYIFLQQQINPHFLYNTLNFIYSAALKSSPAMAASIIKLADLMRYTFQSQDAHAKNALASEAEQLQHLLELNQARFNGQLQVHYDISGPLKNLRIIPLILLTFTENLFKHGDLQNAAEPARISLSVLPGNVLRFVTWNLKKHRDGAPENKGIGLANAIKRLNYAYGEQYQLIINDLADDFRLELTIKL